MRYSIKSELGTCFEVNAVQVSHELIENRDVLAISHNSEAKAVLLGGAVNKVDQRAQALLKILMLGNQQIERGEVMLAADAVARIRGKRAESLHDT